VLAGANGPMDSNAVLPNREWKKMKGRRFLLPSALPPGMHFSL
jgi:hypothetical protein